MQVERKPMVAIVQGDQVIGLFRSFAQAEDALANMRALGINLFPRPEIKEVLV